MTKTPVTLRHFEVRNGHWEQRLPAYGYGTTLESVPCGVNRVIGVCVAELCKL